jgi:hypothetical protein
MGVPSNLYLSKVSRPAWYMCGCMALWGFLSAMTYVELLPVLVACLTAVALPSVALSKASVVSWQFASSWALSSTSTVGGVVAGPSDVTLNRAAFFPGALVLFSI